MAMKFSICTADGTELAEELLNDRAQKGAELVSTHVRTVRSLQSDEQESNLLEQELTRFTFIFRSDA